MTECIHGPFQQDIENYRYLIQTLSLGNNINKTQLTLMTLEE